MITITAMKWAPPFAAGSVRDHRARWILNEAGWPYKVRLIDATDLASKAYRSKQPFGQVPYMEEDGRPTLFESGAIILDVATRANILLPKDENDRSLVNCWFIAALNSVEPFLMNVAEVEYFIEEKAQKEARRPAVVAMAEERLGALDAALGVRRWLVGNDFTIADLMLASVLKIARGLELLKNHPTLVAYQDRCLDRDPYKKAVADQCVTIEQHKISDMRFNQVERENV